MSTLARVAKRHLGERNWTTTPEDLNENRALTLRNKTEMNYLSRQQEDT